MHTGHGNRGVAVRDLAMGMYASGMHGRHGPYTGSAMDTLSKLRMLSPFHQCNAFRSSCQSAHMQTIPTDLCTLLDVLQAPDIPS